MAIDPAYLRSVDYRDVPEGALLEVGGIWHRMVVRPPEGDLKATHIAYELLDQQNPETSMVGTKRGLVLSPEQVVRVFDPMGL